MTNFSPEKCKQLIQTIAGTYNKDDVRFELANVLSIDTQNWLCSAKTVSGLSSVTYNNVQLSAEQASDGFTIVPKVGSNVMLAITVRNEVYVYMVSDIDSTQTHRDNGDGTYTSMVVGSTIQMNDGSYGGLVKLIDAAGGGILARLNALEQAFNTHIHIGVQTGGGVSGVPQSPITETTRSQLENETIIHGKP